MTPVALLLVLVSAAAHAVWNYLVKASPHKVAFLWGIQVPALAVFLPLYWAGTAGGAIPFEGWLAIVASAVIHTGYTLSLGAAYERGDLSLVYPLARSAPLFVPLWALLFLDERPTAAGGAGILLVVAGAYVIGSRALTPRALLAPIVAIRSRPYQLALLTAFLISLYSVVDKVGVGHVAPLRYMFLMELLQVGLLGAAVLPTRRGELRALVEARKGRLLLTGILRYGSYVLILYAYRLSPVSYVTATRQVSILMGVGLGSLVLGEEAGLVRLTAAGLIVGGILLIALRG